MSTTRSSLTVDLLRNYYPDVVDLRLYLVRIVECNGDGGSLLFGDADPVEYQDLVNGTYVASKGSMPSSRFKSSPPMMYMRDVSVFLDSYAVLSDMITGDRPSSGTTVRSGKG
jgi:hypothetical protein